MTKNNLNEYFKQINLNRISNELKESRPVIINNISGKTKKILVFSLENLNALWFELISSKLKNSNLDIILSSQKWFYLSQGIVQSKNSKNDNNKVFQLSVAVSKLGDIYQKISACKKLSISETDLLTEIEQSPDEEKNHHLLINLLKFSELQPALLVIKNQDFINLFLSDLLSCKIDDLSILLDEKQNDIKLVAHTPFDMIDMENSIDATLYAYMQCFPYKIHYAIVISPKNHLDTTQKASLLRIHSSCFTGDLLESIICDCKDNLHGSLLAMKKYSALNKSKGVLIYLNQEGREIGALNKLRAYKLQSEGVSSYAADTILGFSGDERSFNIASSILHHLSINNVSLITQNKNKKEELAKRNINVESCVSLTQLLEGSEGG